MSNYNTIFILNQIWPKQYISVFTIQGSDSIHLLFLDFWTVKFKRQESRVWTVLVNPNTANTSLKRTFPPCERCVVRRVQTSFCSTLWLFIKTSVFKKQSSITKHNIVCSVYNILLHPETNIHLYLLNQQKQTFYLLLPTVSSDS